MSKEREKQILEILLKNNKASVKELAEALYISQPSIRRDLTRLEKQNLIKRIHGGAVIEETALSKNKIPFAIRELEGSSEKIEIARKASELIHDNFVIFLDASTSAYNILPFLVSKKNLTVITNGIRALEQLAAYGINSISTGGNLVASCLSLVGEDSYRTIERYNADICFFACRALSDDGELTDISPEENNVRIHMMKHSERSYMLCTSDKIGKKHYHNLCHKDDLDGIITAK